MEFKRKIENVNVSIIIFTRNLVADKAFKILNNDIIFI